MYLSPISVGSGRTSRYVGILPPGLPVPRLDAERSGTEVGNTNYIEPILKYIIAILIYPCVPMFVLCCIALRCIVLRCVALHCVNLLG